MRRLACLALTLAIAACAPQEVRPRVDTSAPTASLGTGPGDHHRHRPSAAKRRHHHPQRRQPIQRPGADHPLPHHPQGRAAPKPVTRERPGY